MRHARDVVQDILDNRASKFNADDNHRLQEILKDDRSDVVAATLNILETSLNKEDALTRIKQLDKHYNFPTYTLTNYIKTNK